MHDVWYWYPLVILLKEGLTFFGKLKDLKTFKSKKKNPHNNSLYLKTVPFKFFLQNMN